MAPVPTIKVRYPFHGGNDFATINEADFDPTIHTPFDQASATAVGVPFVPFEAAGEGESAPAEPVAAPKRGRGRPKKESAEVAPAQPGAEG